MIEFERKEAARLYNVAVESLAMVFNPCDFEWIPHRYSKRAQKEFIRLAAELKTLIEAGEVEPNPAHAMYC